MAYQLILTSDTLDQGRIKINDFFQSSSSGIFSGSTGAYSIISLGNDNFANGNRTFVAGYKNSGITGNYNVINNGYKNYSRASFGAISNGYKNQIRNSTNNYSGIFNGKQNYIYTNAVGNSSYNLILNGKLNKIKQNYHNTIINGLQNVVGGTYNTVINGSYNLINNNSSTGPYNNVIFGNSNYISGSTNVNSNLLFGVTNRLNNVIGGVGSVARGNIVGGRFHAIYKGSNCLLIGNSLTNVDAGGVGRNNIISFGQGSSSFATSNIKPINSYSMIMGTSAAGRNVRIEFGASPNAFLRAGAWQNTGADYGEYFEWLDKNINNEERVGFFVSLKDGKIEISKTNNAIGVISNATAFIGDSNQELWSETFLKDEWGVEIKKKYHKYSFDFSNENKEYFFNENDICFEEVPNTNNKYGIINTELNKKDGTFIEEVEFNVINPNYDPANKYLPRDKRNEWSVVGLLGKLRVRTCENITGQYVDVDVNTGMAKNGTTYPVLKKYKDYNGNYGIVLIFFK